MITTLLSSSHRLDKQDRYLNILEEINKMYPDSRKIKGAYQVAKTNLNKNLILYK